MNESQKAKLVDEYLKSIDKQYRLGISTEHSHRGSLQSLLCNLYPEYVVTNEPRRIECGAPDYVVSKSRIPVGYIEAKDINKNLPVVERGEQLDRYLSALDNLILTDYLEFRFYRNGERIAVLRIAETDRKGRVVSHKESYRTFLDTLDSFFDYSGQTISSASALARKMAVKARQLALVVKNVLECSDDERTALAGQYEAFRKLLISDMSNSDFADMYAQTVAYGLFAARLSDDTPEDFSREEARGLIPKSNPFLRNLFDSISGINIDDEIVWIVDDLSNLFARTNVASMFKEQVERDPFIHFYETFLGEYDPELKKSCGVYYTPQPVVEFIVGCVDEILEGQMNASGGLASAEKTDICVEAQPSKGRKTAKDTVRTHKVQILDPACGTGTFIASVIRRIHSRFKGQEGMWSSYVEEELIPRVNGFELLMAPYTVSHLKTEMLLRETGYEPTGRHRNQRLNIFLTNTVEKAHEDTLTLFSTWLAEESIIASRIKKETPVYVVIGNPPYSAESTNNGDWLKMLMEDYKKEPGTNDKLDERNSKWVNDDYAKFIRYAEYLICRTGKGLVAYINPHGWLDNPSFRGMRWHLLRSFDSIYVVNLHGNANKAEKAPDGLKDENVFDIRQGVCINIFVKTTDSNDFAKVYYADLWGDRESKYAWLDDMDFSSVEWTEVHPEPPMYYMISRDSSNEDSYRKGFSVKDLFIEKTMGITTGNDAAVYRDSKEEAECIISELLSSGSIGETREYKGWTYESAAADLRAGYQITRICFRPFEQKYTAYTGNSTGWMTRPRPEIMPSMRRNNIALVSTRLVQKGDFHHAFVTDAPTDKGILSGKDNAYVFPLWIYRHELGDYIPTSNLDSRIVNEIKKRIAVEADEGIPGNETDEQMIFDYVYGVLWSSAYREKYQVFLKEDYPIVPYPDSLESFLAISDCGGQLRHLHTMRSNDISVTATFPIAGDNKVTNVKRVGDKVYINKFQYIGNVSDSAWEEEIGAYKPAQKLLKDSKGETLTYSTISGYQKAIAILEKTGEIRAKLDAILYSNG